MTHIITDEELKAVREARTLYEVTGNIMDANTLLIPRSALDKLQGVEVVGYSVTCDGVHCGNTFDTEKGAVAQKERLDRSHSENTRTVEPLYAVKD